MAHKVTPVTTRSRKGSLKDSVTIDDITTLLRDTEDRIKNCFKDEISRLTAKIVNLEANLSIVQNECALMDSELSKMRRTIVSQQLQIEGNETKLRANNLIINNIPESDLSSGVVQLANDQEKIQFVIRSAKIEVKPEDIVSLHRLGKKQSERSRPLKVILKDPEKKYRFLNKRKEVITNSELHKTFHSKIFVNIDSSFLTQKEEYRLRQSLKKLKADNPNIPSFIRAGSLHSNGQVIDKIDIRNQLF